MAALVKGRVTRDVVIRWDIPSLFLKINERLRSPWFSCFGCSWYLNTWWRSEEELLYISLKREIEDTGYDAIEMTCTLGLPERASTRDWTFRRGSWNCHVLSCKQSDLDFREKLTLTCQMQCHADDHLAEPRVGWWNPKKEESTELQVLSSDLLGLLNSGNKSDVVLKVQGKEFRAHKALLCARSPVFRAIFDHDLEEQKTGAVTIEDCEPELFSQFLSFVYTGKVGRKLTFDTAVHLYAVSDKYNVQDLKSVCSDYLKQSLTSRNLCRVTTLADMHSDWRLQLASQVFFNANYLAVLTTPEWEAMMLSNPGIAGKMLKKMASRVVKKGTKRKHECWK